MNFRAFSSLNCLFTLIFCLIYSANALSGYRAFLDPRSMAMGGTGVAAANKFNASAHNPALIAFIKGNKPDKIYLNVALGTREVYNEDLNSDVIRVKDSGLIEKYNNTEGSEFIDTGNDLIALLEDVNHSSYRQDEFESFSLLVDTAPITINFFTRKEVRKQSTLLFTDAGIIERNAALTEAEETQFLEPLSSAVHTTAFELKELGITVATTNVIDYNMPISWGFSPKLIEFNSKHTAARVDDYDINSAAKISGSESNLEWNLDVGFAILFTDDFLQNEFGLDGEWLEGEWVFGFSGMNLFPTDIQSFGPIGEFIEFPKSRPALQALYQIGMAHYREKFMATLDIELTEDEVYTFDGLSRFISFGGEYYWRDDFHLRGGLRVNASQPDGGSKEGATLSAGFLYQPHGFKIEGAVMVSDIELGGTMGFGVAF